MYRNSLGDRLQMDRIRKWFRRVPIPVAFIICGLACLLAALCLTQATVWFAQRNIDQIEEEYVQFIGTELTPAEGYEAAHPLLEPVLIGKITDFSQLVPLAESDRVKYDFFVGLDDIAAVLWYSICLCLAAVVFYLWKLKKPFRVLNQAVRKISANDLDFHIEYEGQDEFGRLCHAFEIMRQELEQNNKKMWNSVEERKRLNAAFAHDLRTPLTVMRGHTDMLLATLTEENNLNDEIASSVQAISNQIARLGAFADTMGSLQRLEDYEPCPKPISAFELTEILSQTAAALFPNGQAEICSELTEQEFMSDKEALAQICENILSNSARYAKEKVNISLCWEQEYLIITIEDDGIGFSEKDLKNASLAYYRGDKTQSDTVSHFGLGLYISSVLAKKLGGGLQLSNGTNGGAKILIKIRCI